MFITVFTTAYNYINKQTNNSICTFTVTSSTWQHGLFAQGRKKIRGKWRKRPAVELHGLSRAKYFKDVQFKQDEIGRTFSRSVAGVKYTPTSGPKYVGKKRS
jgi:hypothetical protein